MSEESVLDEAPEVEEAPADEAEAEVAEEAPEEAEAPAEAEADPPNEPDDPAEEDLLIPEEELPEEEDPAGVVTKLSPDLFKKLSFAWVKAGNPRKLNAYGRQWMVVDNGAKFVDKGVQGGMGDYGSLSTTGIR
jgi:hypothetical protein